MKKGILFDLDGTLWDSSRQVAESWVLALKDLPEVKTVVTVESVQAVMGKSMEEIADIVFGGFNKVRRMELLEHCFDVENRYIREHGGTLFEGLEEALTQLKKNYHLYIVSNCQTGYIEAFLEYHKMRDFFDDFECYGATGRPKGENIRLVIQRNHLEQAIYVGDTQGDYQAASFAGIPFVHARTGYGRIDGEVPYIESLSQLPALAQELMQM